MSALQVPLYSAAGETKGQFDLPETIFGAPGSRRVLQEVVVALQANQRQGTSSTKTRSFVSGGGHKPWKQKGTGNARSGSNRSPLWRKGGIIFGPLPRSYRTELDQAKKWIALKTALVEKVKAAGLGIFETLQVKEPKTREAQSILAKAGVSGKVLVVVDQKDKTFCRAFGNIKGITVADAAEINAWTLMAFPKILFTKTALEALEKRWPKG